MIGWLAPCDLPQGPVALHHRKMDVCRAQPQEHLPTAAEFAELGEDQADCLLDTFIGIHLDTVILTPAEARWQSEAKLAPAGLGIAGGQAPLPQKVEFVFRHGSLQPQQQPIIHQAWIVNALGVNYQGPGQGAEINQMMPVPAIARQPGSLDAIDRPDQS